MEFGRQIRARLVPVMMANLSPGQRGPWRGRTARPSAWLRGDPAHAGRRFVGETAREFGLDAHAGGATGGRGEQEIIVQMNREGAKDWIGLAVGITGVQEL